MLRVFVLLLMLLNTAYFSWSHGFLDNWGMPPRAAANGAEPERLKQQIQPQALHVMALSAQAATSAAAAASSVPIFAISASAPAFTTASTAATPPISSVASKASETVAVNPQSTTQSTVCLQAGLFNEAQTTALRTRLQERLKPEQWKLQGSIEAARWMIYMGKYQDAAMLAKKSAELKQRGVEFEVVTRTDWSPGISLGRFASQAEAQQALGPVTSRGVRTARIVQERAEVQGQQLVLTLPGPQTTAEAQLAKLDLPLADKKPAPCSTAQSTTK